MISTSFLQPPRLRGQQVLLVLLVLLFLVCAPTTASAASANEICVANPAPAGALVANFTNETVGNRGRMVQVACVLVAIGVFILTRSTK